MTDDKPRKERRNHIRLKKDFPVQVAFRFPEENNKESPIQMASILNISTSGVCIEMEGFNEQWKDDLLFGRIIITLKIELPEKEEPISVLARAVWITKTEGAIQSEHKTVKHLMGARFIKIAAEEDAIRHYIIKHFL